MDTVTGLVTHIYVEPGRPDLLIVRLRDREGGPGDDIVNPDHAKSSVTFDGVKVDAAGLLARLLKAEGGVKAVLYSDGECYGVTRKAEFTSLNVEG